MKLIHYNSSYFQKLAEVFEREGPLAVLKHDICVWKLSLKLHTAKRTYLESLMGHRYIPSEEHISRMNEFRRVREEYDSSLRPSNVFSTRSIAG